MAKKRIFRWIWITAGVLMLLAGGAYLAMDMAVNYTLKKMADLESIETEVAIAPEETLPVAPVAGTTDPKPPETSQGETEEATTADDETDDGGSQGGATEDASADSDNKTAQPAETSAPATTGGYQPEIAGDTAKALQEKVTTKEKLAVAGVLMEKFSAGELKEFAALAADGITVEDKKAAKDTFLSRLSEEEYNRLIAIAAKYGLSQGRKYDESKQDIEAEAGTNE